MPVRGIDRVLDQLPGHVRPIDVEGTAEGHLTDLAEDGGTAGLGGEVDGRVGIGPEHHQVAIAGGDEDGGGLCGIAQVEGGRVARERSRGEGREEELAEAPEGGRGVEEILRHAATAVLAEDVHDAAPVDDRRDVADDGRPDLSGDRGPRDVELPVQDVPRLVPGQDQVAVAQHLEGEAGPVAAEHDVHRPPHRLGEQDGGELVILGQRPVQRAAGGERAPEGSRGLTLLPDGRPAPPHQILVEPVHRDEVVRPDRLPTRRRRVER